MCLPSLHMASRLSRASTTGAIGEEETRRTTGSTCITDAISTGTIGITGTIRPLVTDNNAIMNSSDSQVVAAGNNVPLNTSCINGTAIIHVAGSPMITLAPNQMYYATYSYKTNDSRSAAQFF